MSAKSAEIIGFSSELLAESSVVIIPGVVLTTSDTWRYVVFVEVLVEVLVEYL